MSQHRAAKRPAPRQVPVRVDEGDFAGWECVALASFPAGWIVELGSGDFGRILAVLERIVVSHNFPDVEGNVAATLADVDFDGLLAIVEAFTEALQRLPPR